MTVQEIIEAALGHIGVHSPGMTLDADDAAHGLQSLEGMLMSLPALSRRLTRTRISAAHTAEENERLFNTTGSNLTVTLPEEIEDADDEESDTNDYRPPKNGAVVGVSGATYGVYVYVEMLGAWKQLNGLALTDDNPLGPEHDEGLAYMLAIRLAPAHKAAVSEIVYAGAAAGRSLIRQRFRQVNAPAIDQTLIRTSAWRRQGYA